MKKIAVISIACGIAGFSTIANAQALQFTGMQLPNPNTGVIMVNSSTENVYMGALTFSTGSGSIVTYCADLLSPLNNSNNPYSVSIVDQSNGSGLALAAKIMGTYFDSANTPDEQQGLQLAIWEAIYDNGGTFDYAGGNMTVVSGVNATALGFASSYYSTSYASGSAGTIELYSSQGGGGQDQLHIVPEPATFAVLGLGVLGFIRRRKLNKN